MSGPASEATEHVDPTQLRARHRVGTTLRDKWRLDALLGVGGMAAVYAGTHRNGSRGALKLLHAELSVDPHVRARFLKEGYAANKVEHPGVVRVLDDDVTEDGSLFMVMELLDGESLEARRERLGGRLTSEEVLSIADQLLDVLAAAHDRGIIHRDIKPENVFLTRDGTIKVLDFGIARLRELSTPSQATRSGSTMGTPAFMSPEHARGLWDEVDARSDLWSVGASLFELLTGKLVHDGRTTNEQLLSAMTQPARPLASVLPGAHPALAALVDTALAFDKDRRFTDARAMQHAVRRAYHELENGAPITSRPKLTVPESVPNRTLASANDLELGARVLPTTGAAVSAGRSNFARRAAPSPRRAFVLAAAVLCLVAGFGALVILMVERWDRERARAEALASGVVAAP
ncbi:MAG: serine/threonine-protein kinase, partial [Sorangiineae bacterium]|nr:serine/threonine-protein kinase [Sorangiineae bacterium]